MRATTLHTTYRTGSWCAVVAEGGIAVLSADVPAEVAARIWERLGRGNGLSPVLEELTGAFGTSLTAIPPFAVALVEGTAVRVAVRGDLAVEASGAGAPERVSGTGVTTWNERVIEGASIVEVTTATGAPSDAWYPIVDGIVFAGGLRVVLDPAAALPAPASAAKHAGAKPATGSAAQTPAAESAQGAAPASSADPGASPAAPALDESAAPAPAEPDGLSLIDTDSIPLAIDGITWVPLDSTVAPATKASDPAPATGEYDDLWGETIARPIEAAAVRPEEADPAAADAPATDPEAPTGDHDGATISVAQLRALRGATTDPGTDPAPVAAPVVSGRIRLSTGQVVELDRTVVIGRRPRSTRVSADQLPHLIAVDSPEQDISRSHVEIRLEGDSVIVVDLHTTNGTTLIRGGSDPVRLHPGEQTVVVTGDVIDLGDGVTVLFEDLP